MPRGCTDRGEFSNTHPLFYVSRSIYQNKFKLSFVNSKAKLEIHTGVFKVFFVCNNDVIDTILSHVNTALKSTQ